MPTGVNENRSLDERLDRLEAALNQTQKTLDRLASMIDGNPSWHVVGIADRLEAYIKANEDWKADTERRIMSNDNRIVGLEAGNRAIVLSRSAAFALVIIGSLCLVVAFLLLTWLQRAG